MLVKGAPDIGVPSTHLVGTMHASTKCWQQNRKYTKESIYLIRIYSKRRHDVEPLLDLCWGNPQDSPHKGPVMGSSDVFCEEAAWRINCRVIADCDVTLMLFVIHLLPGNLLLNQPVTQSSIYQEYNGPPAVVDGDTGPDWHEGHCSSTSYEAYPWISIDMGEDKRVLEITVFNRRTRCKKGQC